MRSLFPWQDAHSITELRNYLAEATSLVSRALDNGGRNVQIALFLGLQTFFTRLDRWGSQDDDNDQQQHRGGIAEVQVALGATVEGLLLREIDVSVETIRKERAQATLSYAQLGQKAGGPGLSEQLRQSTRAWWETERSETVRRLLGKTLEAPGR